MQYQTCLILNLVYIIFGEDSKSEKVEKQSEDFREMCSGDIKAFERLFVSMYPGLCNIANYYLKNEMLSKDIAQETFIKWWSKRKDFKDFAAVKSFLYVTVRNQSLNYIRDHQKEVDISDIFFKEDEDDFDLMVIEEEAINALYASIERLPAQSARIMRLVIKGYKNQEIADQLGISVNSVKTLKYNALSALRKELEGFVLVLLAWLEICE